MPNVLAPIHGTPYIGGQTPAILYVAAGDALAFNVDSAATITRLTLILDVIVTKREFNL